MSIRAEPTVSFSNIPVFWANADLLSFIAMLIGGATFGLVTSAHIVDRDGRRTGVITTNNAATAAQLVSHSGTRSAHTGASAIMIQPGHTPGICSRCNLPGHTFRQCLQCKTCHAWGHPALRCPTHPPAIQTSSRASSSTPAPIISDVPLALLQHHGLAPPHGAPPPPPPLAVPPPPPPPAAPPPNPAPAAPGTLAAALARRQAIAIELATAEQQFNAAAPGSIPQRIALMQATALGQEYTALEAMIAAVSLQPIHPSG
jgi:hypothetical protein